MTELLEEIIADNFACNSAQIFQLPTGFYVGMSPVAFDFESSDQSTCHHPSLTLYLISEAFF